MLYCIDWSITRASVIAIVCNGYVSNFKIPLFSYVSPVGIDFKIRTIELDNKKIKLQIW